MNEKLRQTVLQYRRNCGYPEDIEQMKRFAQYVYNYALEDVLKYVESGEQALKMAIEITGEEKDIYVGLARAFAEIKLFINEISK